MIGILHGEGLCAVVISGQEEVVRRPKIIGGTEGVVGVKAGNALDDDGIICSKEGFEGGKIAADSIDDIQPTGKVADIVGKLFGVDVAVLGDGFDLLGDLGLAAFPAVEVERHGEGCGTAVVDGLEFVGGGGEQNSCGQRLNGGGRRGAKRRQRG